MRTLILLLFINFLFGVNFNASAAPALTWTEKTIPKVIQMCWHNGYPYAGENLTDGGLVTALVRAVMYEAGFEPVMNFVPWARCKQGAKLGQYDMPFAMWNDVDQHKKDFDFLMASNLEHTSFVVLHDSKLKSSIFSELKNTRLALFIHGGYDDKLINHTGFNFSYVSTDEQKIKMLKLGRVDLMIGDMNRFTYELKHTLKDDSTKLRSLTPSLKIQRSSPSISKKNPHKQAIISRYNSAYLRLCQKGILKSIIKQHDFNFDPIDCPEQ